MRTGTWTVAIATLMAGVAMHGRAVCASDPDYADPNLWLCRPGRADACTVPQDATVIDSKGRLTREEYHAAKDPKVDCFYVYPTVSTQTTANSDLTVTAAERNVVRAQFARFGSVCRQFAPMYRQVTLTALRAAIAGKPMQADRALGYNDVLAAWNYYLQHDNRGRGVVLVGHSQGSGVLTQLIQNEIDAKPVQGKMISAILMGTNLQVPKGADVGGAFKNVPLCRSNAQTGCAIAFADFRDNLPPPSNARFGKAPEGMQAACTNPASLKGGPGMLDAYLSSRRVFGAADTAEEEFPWTNPPQKIDTPFVKVPGLLSAECVSNEHGSYLAVSLHPDDGGARVNDISGDVVVGGKVLPEWGLHLIDAHLNMGNLLHIVADESKAYLARHP